MPANTSPIFVLTPNTGFGANTTAANTAVDGTGTVVTSFTAGTNGSYVKRITFKAAGTNVATVARLFINNGSTNGTAANNSLVGEVALPATTASNSAAITNDIEYTLNRVIPGGYKVNWCIGTAVAAGWNSNVEGGDF
jgi:hypothetical protein